MNASESSVENANTPATTPPPPPVIRTAPPAERLPTTATVRRCILWIVIAYVAGANSFLVGWTANDASPGAMVLGIALYGAFIGVVSSSGGFRRRLQRPFLARSFKVGYGLRLAICIVPGAAMTIDMFPGILAVIAGDLLKQDVGFNNFHATLVSTLVQGTLINMAILLVVFGAWLLQKMFMEWKPPVLDARACAECGYHLETLEAETTATCPECGRINTGFSETRRWVDRVSWTRFLLVLIPAGVVGILAQSGTLLLFR